MTNKLLVVVILLLSALNLRAQTTTPSSNPTQPLYQIEAGYSSIGGPTNNGTMIGLSRFIASRVLIQTKGFLLSNPTGVTIQSLGPRYRPPLSAIFKPSAYLDTSKVYLFVDLNLGAVKNPDGSTKFAYGAGGGIDYCPNETVCFLAIEADYYRSTILPTGSTFIHNLRDISTGIKLNF